SALATPWGGVPMMSSHTYSVVTAVIDSARLAVGRLGVAPRAVLGQLEPVGVVPPVLLGDVVALLAHIAGKGDLRTHVRSLGGHWSSSRSTRAGGWYGGAGCVAGAEIEPATSRL